MKHVSILSQIDMAEPEYVIVITIKGPAKASRRVIYESEAKYDDAIYDFLNRYAPARADELKEKLDNSCEVSLMVNGKKYTILYHTVTKNSKLQLPV